MFTINATPRNPPDGYIDPNFPNPHGSDDARIIIYGYRPNFVLCILALAFFSLALLAHVFRLLQYRAWAFATIVVACTMEVVGYSFRYQSSQKDPYRITWFIVQYFFIVVAPVVASAGIYVCLSKLIHWSVELGMKIPKILNPKGILWLFISIDCISTAIQVSGAALIGHAEANRKDPTTANDILLSGLAFQSASFLVYLCLLGIFSRTMRRDNVIGLQNKHHIGGFLRALWITSILVFMRTIYRLAETGQGVFGFARTHEIFFGLFEFAPIVIAMTLLAIWYPEIYLKSCKKVPAKEADV